jgi:hypothetical protein
MTWCLGLAVTLALTQKAEKNVKVNCDNMQGPLTVFSTADHQQKLYNSGIGVLHAWSNSNTQAILVHENSDLEGGFNTGVLIFLSLLLFYYFRNFHITSAFFLRRNLPPVCFIIQTTSLFL